MLTTDDVIRIRALRRLLPGWRFQRFTTEHTWWKPTVIGPIGTRILRPYLAWRPDRHHRGRGILVYNDGIDVILSLRTQHTFDLPMALAVVGLIGREDAERIEAMT